MAEPKRTRRTTTNALLSGNSGMPTPAKDVTAQPADVVMGMVKLTCDNDTNVVFYRHNGKLYMASVQR